MKVLKHSMLLIAAIVMSVSMTACGGGGDDDPGTGGGTKPPTGGTVSETVSAADITSVSATVYGKVKPYTAVSTFQVGAVLSHKAQVSMNDYELVGNPATMQNGEYSISFGGLKANTKYYYRSFFYDGKSYIMGEVKSFTTASSKYASVDMGLPSKTLWATTNVGAEKPEDYGSYFVWSSPVPMGNVRSKVFDVDENGDIIPADILSLDAGHVYFGEGWHAPSKKQMEELLSEANCTWQWCDGVTTRYNNTSVAGYKVTSKANGKVMFFPAAGYYDGLKVVEAGKCGYFWSLRGKIEVASPICLAISSTFKCTLGMSQEKALTVRPVMNPE